jgi:glycosyltransferase involved in cell wall biosynthesis
MPAADPILSICVPTFNRAWMLKRNLDHHLAAFRALGLAFEIVVVDDCSTDDTASYLASLATTPELSVFRRHTNSGFLDNYAFAMQRARGRYAVFLGDDDLLIPDQVMACLATLEADGRIGMIQAPWMLVDERAGGGEIGPFYRLPGPARFAQGNHAGLAQFIFDHHVFPEFMIVRRDVLTRSISSACPFIFWAFLYTGRALNHADILFVPAPFARVTAMSDDPRAQQGNRETMFQWDHYRGGIEFIVSLAGRNNTPALGSRAATAENINRFMSVRKKVALRLLVGDRHWIEAYILLHRIAAYEPMPVTASDLKQIGLMAAFTAAAKDAASFAAARVAVDPLAETVLLDLLRPELRARLGAPGEALADNTDAPRSYLRLDPAFPAALKPSDAVFAVSDYVAQFA